MKTGAQLVGEATAQALLTAMRIRDAQFRHATPPRQHMRLHDRRDGPAGRNPTIHMLVRSVNKGYCCELSETPHIHPRHLRTV